MIEYEHKTVLLTINELDEMRDGGITTHLNIGGAAGWRVIHSIQLGTSNTEPATMFVLERPNPLQRA